MRLALRVAAILAGLIFCLALHYLWKLLRARPIWPQIFLGYVGACCGLRVRVQGAPLKRKVLVAANHVSWLDVLALGGAAPVNFVARGDVAGWPVVGWAASLNDTIFVDRDVRSSVRGQADALREALAEGRAVALFPEGTTDGGADLLPFRASLFASLFPPLDGVAVQPVAIDYGTAVGDVLWLEDEAFGANAKRILSRPGTLPVTLHFLPPIDPRAAGDRKALAARSQAEVAQALVQTPLGASLGGGDPLYPPR
ncbi:MAG: 1-acyl-sn-glycerol-3-phosphate acyltransferase [Sphingomonadaceae bacterium]|nr:1-acyl-sn-glycerol-3-phosphate acyltransferase [Sphingomonadaceae bacterium]